MRIKNSSPWCSIEPSWIRKLRFLTNLFLSATEDYRVTINAGPFKSIAKVLDKTFEAEDCEPCLQVSQKLTEKPIDYIFDVMEYQDVLQDVLLVTEFENQYKVIRYQPKTED